MEKGQPRQGGQLSAVKSLPNSLQASSKNSTWKFGSWKHQEKVDFGRNTIFNLHPDFFHTGLGAAFSSQGVIRGELMSSYERRLKVCWERGGRAADAGVVEFVAQSPMTAVLRLARGWLVGGSQDLGLLDTSTWHYLAKVKD